MDLDKNRFLGTQMGIQSIPTFLYVYKGQVVKKQSGANSNAILQNIAWMKSTYNLNAAPAPQKQAPKTLPGFKIYKEQVQPYFFKSEKWEVPITKIHAYFDSKKLYTKSEMKDVHLALMNVKGFAKTSSDNKIIVTTAIIEHAPVNDCDNLLPFLDFLRIAALEEEVNQFISESIYDLLENLISTFYIENSFASDQNPKSIRIILWRLMANLCKFESGSELLFSIYDQVLMAAHQCLTDLKENTAMVKSMSMAINNLIFAEYGLECDDDIKYQLFSAFAGNLNSPTENTVIATLNILCRLSKGDSDLISRVKSELPVLVAQLDGLKLSKNTVIGQFAEDLQFILK
jgi:hypothetical protein